MPRSNRRYVCVWSNRLFIFVRNQSLFISSQSIQVMSLNLFDQQVTGWPWMFFWIFFRFVSTLTGMMIQCESVCVYFKMCVCVWVSWWKWCLENVKIFPFQNQNVKELLWFTLSPTRDTSNLVSLVIWEFEWCLTAVCVCDSSKFFTFSTNCCYKSMNHLWFLNSIRFSLFKSLKKNAFYWRISVINVVNK